MSAKITAEELQKHKSKDDCWIVIDGQVYDVSKFHEDHPGEGLFCFLFSVDDCCRSVPMSAHKLNLLKGINNEYIANHGGHVVTDLFEKYHCNDEPFEWLEQARDGKHKTIKWVGEYADS